MRFRLATLLALVTGISLVFGCLAPIISEKQQEARIIAAVQQQLSEGQSASFLEDSIGFWPISNWPGLPRVTEVTVILESGIASQATVTEHADHQNAEIAEELARLRHLKTLRLVSDELSNTGLLHLKKLRRLEVLDLRCPMVTSEGIERLEVELPGLRVHDD